jgi:HAD superfamily hydrolase (TIGR01509 family)
VYRFFIWDFDGTLVDSYPGIVQAFDEALGDFGCHEDPDEIHALCMNTLSHCAETLCERFEIDQDAFEAAFSAHYSVVPATATPVIPGVMPLCRRIQAAGGQNMVFTHRQRETMEAVMEARGMNDAFVDAQTTRDGYPSKPDPTAFLALMERHGATPDETLAVGDRVLDVEAGQNAGMATCYYGPALPEGCAPDYAVSDYAELEAILFPADDAPVVG